MSRSKTATGSVPNQGKRVEGKPEKLALAGINTYVVLTPTRDSSPRLKIDCFKGAKKWIEMW